MVRGHVSVATNHQTMTDGGQVEDGSPTWWQRHPVHKGTCKATIGPDRNSTEIRGWFISLVLHCEDLLAKKKHRLYAPVCTESEGNMMASRSILFLVRPSGS